MKIVVCSKNDLKTQFRTDKSWFYDPKKYFISIAGLLDGCEYPCPYLTSDSERVCRLLFDDVTELEKDNPAIILFNKDHAKKIFKFVESISKDDPDTSLYVNCTMGISRSGAIGKCLNEFFNKENPDAYEEFFKLNSCIQPNPWVSKVLSSIF